MKTALVSVATHTPPGFGRFAASCVTNDITPAILEVGSVWRGFSWRLKSVMKFVQATDAEVIIHADAYDTECLHPLPVILEKFLSFNHPWVFSWQPDELNRPEPWIHLCAGLWIGKREYVLETITNDWLSEFFPDHFNDEPQLQSMLSWRPNLFALDEKSVLFHTLTSPLPKGASPSFIHHPNVE